MHLTRHVPRYLKSFKRVLLWYKNTHGVNINPGELCTLFFYGPIAQFIVLNIFSCSGRRQRQYCQPCSSSSRRKHLSGYRWSQSFIGSILQVFKTCFYDSPTSDADIALFIDYNIVVLLMHIKIKLWMLSLIIVIPLSKHFLESSLIMPDYCKILMKTTWKISLQNGLSFP